MMLNKAEIRILLEALQAKIKEDPSPQNYNLVGKLSIMLEMAK